MKKLLVLFLIIGILLSLCACGIYNYSYTYNFADADLTPVAEPQSGTILSGEEVLDGSKITIYAASSNACVVKLKDLSNADCMSFYVRAGDTVTISVPREFMYVYFASGNTWYGEEDLFGSQTSYQKDGSIKDFTSYTWEFKLYPVSNGNLKLKNVNKVDF